MFLAQGEAQERSGKPGDAAASYRAAADEAERTGEVLQQAEALRRLSVLHHHRNERAIARELCTLSHGLARAANDPVLAGEALNVLAGFDFEGGAIEAARARYAEALALAGDSPKLRGRIEQSLGILANIQGNHDEALAHYRRSLDGFERSGDERGGAIAYHNLGMVSADRGTLGGCRPILPGQPGDRSSGGRRTPRGPPPAQPCGGTRRSAAI